MSTSSLWFKVIVFITAAIVTALAITNAIYFNRLRSSKSVSNTAAINLLIINIIVIVLGIIVLLWSGYRLLFSKQARQEIKESVSSKETGLIKSVKSKIY